MKSIPVRKILAAAIALLACVAVIGVFGIRYQTNDDATLSNIAAGGYGSDTLHMVYVNILFACLLRPLYALLMTNWYVIVQLALAVTGIAAIAYLLMEKWGTTAGAILSAALMIGFGKDIFYTFQYTEISFILLSAGLLLLADDLGHSGKRTVLGILFTALGSIIRWSAFPAAGALSAGLLLYRFFALDRTQKKKAILTIVLLFAVVLGAKAVDTVAYRLDPAWDAYTRYNAARTQFSDFTAMSLPEENPYAGLGVSDTDYTMLINWDFYDEERFTTEFLEELSSGKREITAAGLLRETARQLFSMIKGGSYQYAFLLISLLAFCHLRPRKSSLPVIGLYAVFAALLFYLVYRVRFPSWVAMGLTWTMCVFALYATDRRLPAKPLRFLPALVAAAVCLTSLSPYLELYRGYRDYEEWTHLEQGYFEAMSRDKENLYLLSTTAINVAAGFDVFAPRTEGFYSNIVAYGGWLSRAPHRDQALHTYGLRRPLVDAVDHPHVYLDYHNIAFVERYVEQELGCDVFVVETGDNAFAPYQLVTRQPEA